MVIRVAANKLEEKVLRSLFFAKPFSNVVVPYVTAADGNSINVQLKILFGCVSAANA